MECLDSILTSLLEDNIQVWTMKSQSENPQVHTLLDKIDAASDQPLPAVLRASTSLKSPTQYIFTSGTTGKSVALYISIFIGWYSYVNAAHWVYCVMLLCLIAALYIQFKYFRFERCN